MSDRRSWRQQRSAAFALLAMLIAGCGGSPAVVPSSYSAYNAKDGTFACDAPEGWEISGGGKNGPVWAKFESGSALVSIRAGATGSLLSDAMGGRNAEISAPTLEDAPVHRIHVLKQEAAEDEYNDYAEVGTPVELVCSLGPARVSEFTASGSFGGKRHGYRATVIGHEKGVDVICICDESQWSELKPVFDQILASLERGTSEL